MASNPTGPAPVDRPPLRASTQGDDRPERYGTVAVTRHVKDDGRALLLYTRAAEQST